MLVTGATGLVGGRLLPALLDRGHALAALTRRPGAAGAGLDPRATLAVWDGRRIPAESLAGAHAVIHLAGEPVFGGRLTSARRARIRESRVDSTRSIVASMAELPAEERPRVFVCASAVGYYGSRGEEPLDEVSAAGDGFLAEVCVDWEAAAAPAADLGVRRVSLRIGIVLAREGGALPMMCLPFRFGLGGRLGDGRQWVPWIHVTDLVAIVQRVLEDEGLEGAVNAVGPEPVRNADLTRALARQLGRPAFLPAPGFALRLALGELADELLGSRRVMSRKLRERGFEYAHPDLAAALAAELGRS